MQPGNGEGTASRRQRFSRAGRRDVYGISQRRWVRVFPAPAPQPKKESRPALRAGVTKDDFSEFERDITAIMTELASMLLLLPSARPKPPDAAVEAPGIDITDMRVKPTVRAGEAVPVFVRVHNSSEQIRDIELQLTDLRENAVIGRRQETLPPRSSRTVAFSWRTAGRKLGDHTLDARAIILDVT